MFRSSRLVTIALLCCLFAAAGIASPIYVQFSITDPIYQILDGGRFTGHIDTGSGFGDGFPVFCNDYQNILSRGVYEALLSDITDLSETRFGTTPASGFSYQVNNLPLTAADRYTMAAWLTTQYTYPATPTLDDVAIQTAVWTLLAQTGAPAVQTTADPATVQYWLNAAVQVKTNNTALFNTIAQDLRIVTSADVPTAGNRYLSGQQEFVYVDSRADLYPYWQESG